MKTQATPGPNRALLAAAWGLTAGISACLMFHTSGIWYAYNVAWCFVSVFSALQCATNVNNERWPAQ